MDILVKVLLLGKAKMVGSEKEKHGSNVAHTALHEILQEKNNPQVQWNG